MIEILSKLFGRMSDRTLCGVLASALEDCAETNHTIETIRKAWIRDCDFHAGQEHFSYMSEDSAVANLEVAEFTKVFFVLESMGNLERFRPPLQIDEALFEYVTNRYAHLREAVISSSSSIFAREIELECWLLQSNFGRHLIDIVATCARDGIPDLSCATRAIYHEIKRRMLPIDTMDVDSYFKPRDTNESRDQSGVGDDETESSDSREEEPDDIAYGVWTADIVSPQIKIYRNAACERNREVLELYYSSSNLYSLLIRTLSEPAGPVFERNEQELDRVFGNLESLWRMPESATRGRALWDAWMRERFSGLDPFLAYKRTRRLHVAFYEALSQEKFIDSFVSLMVRAG